MVRWRFVELLAKHNWTRYELAQKLKELGMTENAVYQLTDPRKKGRFKRIDHDTLDMVCTVFDAPPGDVLEWAPEKRTKRR